MQTEGLYTIRNEQSMTSWETWHSILALNAWQFIAVFMKSWHYT